MDLSKFFSFLNTGAKEEDLDENMETFKKTPYFKIGMFRKLIQNGLIFKNKVLILFSSMEGTMDVKDIDVAGDVMLYERAWYWISQVDWEDEDWVNDLKISSDLEFVKYLHSKIKELNFAINRGSSEERNNVVKQLNELLEDLRTIIEREN